jgi:hypothetical protein
MSSLNNTQRLIIVVGLLLIASALALVFLRFGYVYEYTNCFRLFVLNERTGSFINDEWGLLARGGELGVLLGIVAPIALSTAAAFIHYGKPKPAVAAPKAVEL